VEERSRRRLRGAPNRGEGTRLNIRKRVGSDSGGRRMKGQSRPAKGEGRMHIFVQISVGLYRPFRER